jgi:hypothetical protein
MKCLDKKEFFLQHRQNYFLPRQITYEKIFQQREAQKENEEDETEVRWQRKL